MEVTEDNHDIVKTEVVTTNGNKLKLDLAVPKDIDDPAKHLLSILRSDGYWRSPPWTYFPKGVLKENVDNFAFTINKPQKSA